MYNISHFKSASKEDVLCFMKAHSFAMVVGCVNDVPVATQVPLLFEERQSGLMLKGHMMRNTDHHKTFIQNDSVLCLFTGAHSYVSATLYSNKQTASTWNYMSVHATGTIKFVNNDSLVEILKQTTNHYEADPASPSNFENLPAEYINRLTAAIVGFEIEVSDIDHVFKLSQNKKEEEYSSIIDRLSGGGADQKIIAQEMKIRRSGLFPASNDLD